MRAGTRSFSSGILALMTVLPGWAVAACFIDSTTNATSVQADSGNGTYNCSLVSTSNNKALSAVTSGITYSIGANGRLMWKGDADVDLVSVFASSGKRCNYTYAARATSGMNLSTSDLSAVKGVTFCSDGVANPELAQATPEPISTVGNQCTATFNYDNTSGQPFDVAIGYSKQFEGSNLEGAAICTAAGQKQCINECVPREVPAGTNCTVGVDGHIPLACAPCEWEYPDLPGSGTDLKYCWFHENRVDLVSQTYIPSSKKKSLAVQIDVTSGSNCYTVTVGPLYGGKTYSYQKCP